MGREYRGKNGTEFSLPYHAVWMIFTLLSQLLGREVDVDSTRDAISEDECKRWASLLRKNIERIRQMNIKKDDFVFLEGADLKQLFDTGYYAKYPGSLVTTSDLETARIDPLNHQWKELINDFADFLERSGGLVPLRPFP